MVVISFKGLNYSPNNNNAMKNTLRLIMDEFVRPDKDGFCYNLNR